MGERGRLGSHQQPGFLAAMMQLFKSVLELLNRHAGKVLLAGMAAILWHNVRSYRRDRAAAARRPPAPVMPALGDWPRRPLVSVLVAAWNESENIESHIDCFKHLSYPNKELVLCAGGADGTFRLAQQFSAPQLHILDQKPGEGKQAALRRCLAVASGEIILLTDADTLLNEESFERLIYPIVTGEERVTTGVIRPWSSQIDQEFIRSQWAPRYYREALVETQYARGVQGANSAFSRSAIEQVWRDEREIRTGTDYYLALRLVENGEQLRYIPQSVVENKFPETWGGYIRQQNRWLRNLLLLGWEHHDLASTKHAALTIGIGWSMLLLPFSALFIGRAGVTGWLLAWGAVAAARLRYLRFLHVLNEYPNRFPGLAGMSTILADFIAWASVGTQIFTRKGRARW